MKKKKWTGENPTRGETAVYCQRIPSRRHAIAAPHATPPHACLTHNITHIVSESQWRAGLRSSPPK